MWSRAVGLVGAVSLMGAACGLDESGLAAAGADAAVIGERPRDAAPEDVRNDRARDRHKPGAVPTADTTPSAVCLGVPEGARCDAPVCAPSADARFLFVCNGDSQCVIAIEDCPEGCKDGSCKSDGEDEP